jgi:replicative DNA helicase
MGGLQRSDLIILAGRPAMGKTSLATNIAFNVAKATGAANASPTARNKHPSTAASSASSRSKCRAEQLATRIIAEQAGVSSSDIRRGRITEGDFAPHRRRSPRMNRKLPLYIDQTGGISIAQLAARARRLKRQRGSTS